MRASYVHAFQSLFYLHNESVNIWSHLVGALVAVACAAYVYYVIHPRYEEATSSDVFVFACFFTGAILCLGMSATYHALSDHSQTVAKWGNKLDYTGIVALIVGSYVPPMYYGFFCRPVLMSTYLYLVSWNLKEVQPCMSWGHWHFSNGNVVVFLIRMTIVLSAILILLVLDLYARSWMRRRVLG